MDKKYKAMAASWFRAAASAAACLYIDGQTDPKKLGAAALAGFLGPVLKWLDPNAKEFGRGSKK